MNHDPFQDDDMPIQFACACGKTYQVPNHFAGKSGTCKACGRRNQVPLFVDDIPLDVIQDSPDAKLATTPRKPGLSWLWGLGLAAVGVVGGAIYFASPDGRFDAGRLPESLRTSAALGLVATIAGGLVIGPMLAARRGGLSIVQWLLSFAMFGFLTRFALLDEHPMHSFWPSISGVTALLAVGSLLAAIVYRKNPNA